jgi:hypothetical protein
VIRRYIVVLALHAARSGPSFAGAHENSPPARHKKKYSSTEELQEILIRARLGISVDGDPRRLLAKMRAANKGGDVQL